ncbi:hypothetical protein M6B38_152445 [Iris pallida]|uniref:Uncharacterized protein n=1 Tax=Iris pallida TaxID=29817 RepID=A0AAX6F738_IRIPA|nr:hypothetical protein M6B38_152445 [Iris pallida]
MEFLIPENNPMKSTTSATATGGGGGEVTSCLHLKADKGIEKVDVLRRIRQQKRINAVRNVLRSFLQGSPLEYCDGWLDDDASSSP